MFRSKLAEIVSHRWFQSTVIILILFNAILVGIETYDRVYADHKLFFYYADRVLLWLFTIEIFMRLLSSKPLSFLKSGWNWFDTIIVLAGHLFTGGHFITVLRILRVLRVLRTVSVIPSLRKLVDALIMTIPSLANIFVLMGLLFYIFSVIGTFSFSDISPEYFGNLQRSALTLFQVVTLESWASGVMRPVMADSPWAWFYFVSFVLLGTFIIFNLFIGVIVGNVEKANAEELEEGDHPASKRDVQALKEQLTELRRLLAEQKKSS
ncbi:ion transporter [Shouchella lonarensis]|uniref:Voltage-gated sodium channel n=1 Tax=Shouchella lonarensis TaxID=1464122 RepID=A0A1G6IY49_9BACI|nr:ion transporter [Shouchella lonarensis]SDC11313.1 voltage-gated sodium channel [Shouchella lonarensis]